MTGPAGAGLLRVEVPAALAGERVDRVVATLTCLSRSAVAVLVDAGAVRVGSVAVRHASRRVCEGEVLEVDLPLAPSGGLVADTSVEVVVVYADDQVIVVDKPAGLVVHPGAGHSTGTLVQGLLALFPDLARLGEGEDPDDRDRPGIVQRLDRPTSGLLVVARTAEARASLKAQLATRTMSRRYLGLVWGHLDADAGVVDAPIARAERDPTRMAVMAGGRPARTGYEVLQRYATPPLSLLECRLETGRTHQIRVHLSAIGHPVVGDARYGAGRQGSAKDWPGLRALGPVAPSPSPARRALRPGRIFLHAHELSFEHPGTGRSLDLVSPLPPELEAVLASLAQPVPDGQGAPVA